MRKLPPVAEEDALRVEECRFRRRLLSSQHRDDLREAVVARFGLERGGAMEAAIDWSANTYPGLFQSISGMYVQEPRLRGPSDVTVAAVRGSGHWSKMVRGERDLHALREIFVLAYKAKDMPLQTRIVYPDLFADLVASDEDPSQPGRIGLWLEAGAEGWEYHLFDIIGDDPVFVRSEMVDDKLVERERREGAEFPWFDPTTGFPFIPGVMFHSEDTGYLLDWETGSDVAYGAVALMVNFTSTEHAHAEASWLQRVTVDGELTGAERRQVAATGETEERTVVIGDPSVFMSLKSDADKQARVETLAAPSDVEALMRYNMMRQKMLAGAAGVRAPESTRGESDIRSAYSIVVTREAQAELQLAHRPVLGACDRKLVHRCALLLDEPSSGPDAWKVRYRPLRVSAAELLSRINAAKELVASGLGSRLEAALIVFPELTEEEVLELLEEADTEAAERAAAAVAVMPAPKQIPAPGAEGVTP